jgi:uncharacterized protein YjbI with pentapeptide repeats
MANEEHLQILRQGVSTWNKWREDNENLLPDLRYANEIGVKDLSGVNFSQANLQGVHLGFSPEGVIVRDLILYRANLRLANLRDAAISANLNGANLSGANLSRAIIVFSTFWETQLTGTDFLYAKSDKNVFNNSNLSEAKNLESIRHYGPSSISIDTIYKSGGNIPEKFLRDCGVPEGFITYMRSLVGKAIEFYSCFISYSSKDEEFAKRLYNDLQSEGVRCWFAPEDLKIGERFRVRIDESIRLYDKLLLVLSESSVASEWVEKEVETAFEKEREQKKTVLFPVMLDDAVLEAKTGWAADVRRSRHIGDFREWKNHDSYKKAFERLVRDLKAEASR